MINHEYRLKKIKMYLFDEINRLEAVTPNDGGLTKFEEGELAVMKDIFKKIISYRYPE
tara:strand:+ start:623 stop:796 length:174 start_codon:yes stop_codon:yes gene_type:complete